MHSTTVSSFLDELVKIATGLAPAGAPTVNSKGAGLSPKMPKLTGLPKPGGMPGGMPGMPKMSEAFFDELSKVSMEISKEAKLQNPFHSPGSGAVVGGLGAGGYSAIRHYAKEKKEQAKDLQRNLSPEDQKKAKRKRMIGAAVDTALTGATGAALGAGVGKLNARAKELKAEGRSFIGDLVGGGMADAPAGWKARRAENKAQRAAQAAYDAQQKTKKSFWTKANDNFKENLHNARHHKFASAQ